MSRRPHPYFGQFNRLAAASLAVPRGRAPVARPEEEQGVLWEAFREDKPG